MNNSKTQKRHSVISFINLAPELQEAVKQFYPAGYTDAMIRVDKPDGSFFYAVPFETDEVSYLVKIDVKIDDHLDEEEDKDYYNDDIKGADELADSSDEEEDRDDPVDPDTEI